MYEYIFILCFIFYISLLFSFLNIYLSRAYSRLPLKPVKKNKKEEITVEAYTETRILQNENEWKERTKNRCKTPDESVSSNE